jgi:hypothetical protein
MNEISTLLEEFAVQVTRGKIEIYNEFSLQFELGIFLRGKLSGSRVEFERNVDHFFQRKDFTKKESDIAITAQSDIIPSCVIELKFPRNGQVPEQMFSFCKDIMFLEELKSAGVRNVFFVAFVDDHLFWQGARQDGIYQYFRGDSTIHGSIEKPTGDRGEMVVIEGNYKVVWRPLDQDRRWLVIDL